MPWWSWLIIWSLLVAALIAVLVVGAIHLFRKMTAVVDELEHASSEIERVAEALEDTAEPYVPRANAIVRGRTEVAIEHDEVASARNLRRSRRRAAKLARARALIAADPTRYAHLTEYQRREA